MPADEAAQTSRPGIVRTPDQLQQSKRPEAPQAAAPEVPGGGADGADSAGGGVLDQLRTERAHD